MATFLLESGVGVEKLRGVGLDKLKHGIDHLHSKLQDGTVLGFWTKHGGGGFIIMRANSGEDVHRWLVKNNVSNVSVTEIFDGLRVIGEVIGAKEAHRAAGGS